MRSALAVLALVLVAASGCGSSEKEYPLGPGQLEGLANANLACSLVILGGESNLDKATPLAYGASQADPERWSDLPTWIEATNSHDEVLAANVASRLAALCKQAQSLEADFMSDADRS